MLIPLLVAQLSVATPPTAVAALVAKARRARFQQDSTLAGYTATVKQRMSSSIGLQKAFGIGIPGRPRLAARYESVARVGWHHELGAWGELIGARSAVPMIGSVRPEAEDETALVLPYHPGRDELWPMTELRDAMSDHRDWIDHPLDAGADSLYLFALGDSLDMRLQGGSVVRLREIRVRPRRPAERLIVGSLWVDIASGSIVRAVYRPSTPIDLLPLIKSEVHGDEDMAERLGPYTGIVREVAIEDGLYEGRFWLPRMRSATAEATAKGGLVTLSIEQTFQYESVTGMPPGQFAAPDAPAIDRDPRTGRARYGEYNGVVTANGRCRPMGDSSAAWSSDSLLHDQQLRVVHAGGVRFRMLQPCDLEQLVTTPALPKSIYGANEELFTDSDFKELQAQATKALGMSSQASWSPQPMQLFYGLDRGLLRYNRVEGLSLGLAAERVLGNGYAESALARIGTADRQPNAEASLVRTNTRSEIRGTVYRRLAAANDWGNPLGVGASAVAAVFGRDDGFYYRSLGGELTGFVQRDPTSAAAGWRLFAERDDSAPLRTTLSISKAFGPSAFGPNIQATVGGFAGAGGFASLLWGSNPQAARAAWVTRVEAASGIASFARASSELTVASGLGGVADATITAAGGSTAGTVPPQRLWYLGGASTIRGFVAGSAVGNAFWLGRAELSLGPTLVRPSVFYDIGWAGARSDWRSFGSSMSGTGVGASMVDGMLRFDVARPANRGGKWRVEFYLEPR